MRLHRSGSAQVTSCICDLIRLLQGFKKTYCVQLQLEPGPCTISVAAPVGMLSDTLAYSIADLCNPFDAWGLRFRSLCRGTKIRDIAT